ncbi:hypothetical protein BC827DRAFT_1155935 [Russula dissimulans]|nr:hypothetical protein BC827DRAFT_1155935 [Russula dissimulans]
MVEPKGQKQSGVTGRLWDDWRRKERRGVVLRRSFNEGTLESLEILGSPKAKATLKTHSSCIEGEPEARDRQSALRLRATIGDDETGRGIRKRCCEGTTAWGSMYESSMERKGNKVVFSGTKKSELYVGCVESYGRSSEFAVLRSPTESVMGLS